MAQVPVPWLGSNCASKKIKVNVLVAFATKTLWPGLIRYVVQHDTESLQADTFWEGISTHSLASFN